METLSYLNLLHTLWSVDTACIVRWTSDYFIQLAGWLQGGVSKVVHTPAWSFTFPWNVAFEQIHEILREGKSGTEHLF